MKTNAIIECSGNGHVRGVWVAGPDGSPDVAFLDEIDTLTAERQLGEAADAVDDGYITWDSFLSTLHERQNHITVLRYQGQTELGAPELLSAAQKAQRDDRPLLDLLT